LIELEKDILNLLETVQRNEDNKQFINSLNYRLCIIKEKLLNTKSIVKLLFFGRIKNINTKISIIENILKS
jgi:hypothetical protein